MKCQRRSHLAAAFFVGDIVRRAGRDARLGAKLMDLLRADAGIRTPDPFITSEVLYQLSYVGVARGKRSQPSRYSL
jgi:hypothetical protein